MSQLFDNGRQSQLGGGADRRFTQPDRHLGATGPDVNGDTNPPHARLFQGNAQFTAGLQQPDLSRRGELVDEALQRGFVERFAREFVKPAGNAQRRCETPHQMHITRPALPGLGEDRNHLPRHAESSGWWVVGSQRPGWKPSAMSCSVVTWRLDRPPIHAGIQMSEDY